MLIVRLMQLKSSAKQSPALKNPQYFEGVLQLRNLNEEVIRYIDSQLRKEPVIRIAKEIPQPGGVDLWLSSNKFLLKLAKGLNETFQGELKITSRLHTKNRLTSRNVYRMSVYFKLASFRRGDTINLRGLDMKVLAVGKKIRLQEVLTGKKHEYHFAIVQEAVEVAEEMHSGEEKTFFTE